MLFHLSRRLTLKTTFIHTRKYCQDNWSKGARLSTLGCFYHSQRSSISPVRIPKLDLMSIKCFSVSFPYFVQQDSDEESCRELKNEATGPLSFLISFNFDLEAFFQRFGQQSFPSGDPRLDEMSKALDKEVRAYQKDVIDLLDKLGFQEEEIPPTGKIPKGSPIYEICLDIIVVTGGSNKLWKRIEGMKGVRGVSPRRIVGRIDDGPVSHLDVPTAKGWNLLNLEVASVWELGYQGQGILIASLDTGVLATHISLCNNFIGYSGWYDPVSEIKTPYDDRNHGTATMGIIVGQPIGSKAVGVAPMSKWMSCKCADSLGNVDAADIVKALRFIANVKNEQERPLPSILNISIGLTEPRLLSEIRKLILLLEKKEVTVVTSAGNRGPRTGTCAYPGSLEGVITVGAIDEKNAVCNFSGRGPVQNGVLKPELVAPGKIIRSASSFTDHSFDDFSGTSFACPHVAGVVALMKCARPDLTVQEIRIALLRSAVPLKRSLFGLYGEIYPNFNSGYGKVNALNALRFVLKSKD